MDDKKVKFAIFRDADSRLGPRELFAVNQWLASGLGFHVMRDHKQHSVPVLGGMFGTKRGVLGQSVKKLMQRAILENPNGIQGVRGEDQSFLKTYIWTFVKGNCLTHDIDLKRCKNFGSQHCVDFPVKERSEEKNYFVGAMFKHGLYETGSRGYECHHSCKIIDTTNISTQK